MSLLIQDILSLDCTEWNAPISSKKKLLEHLARRINERLPSNDTDDIFERLISRERLGSTGIGEGIAIPHCRLKECDAPFGILIKLEEAIDYDAVDNQQVDLIFALLVPEEANDEHLKILALLARNFTEPTYRDALRNASDVKILYQRAISQQES